MGATACIRGGGLALLGEDAAPSLLQACGWHPDAAFLGLLLGGGGSSSDSGKSGKSGSGSRSGNSGSGGCGGEESFFESDEGGFQQLLKRCWSAEPSERPTPRPSPTGFLHSTAQQKGRAPPLPPPSPLQHQHHQHQDRSSFRRRSDDLLLLLLLLLLRFFFPPSSSSCTSFFARVVVGGWWHGVLAAVDKGGTRAVEVAVLGGGKQRCRYPSAAVPVSSARRPHRWRGALRGGEAEPPVRPHVQ